LGNIIIIITSSFLFHQFSTVTRHCRHHDRSLRRIFQRVTTGTSLADQPHSLSHTTSSLASGSHLPPSQPRMAACPQSISAIFLSPWSSPLCDSNKATPLPCCYVFVLMHS
jgi:hypothetical protein